MNHTNSINARKKSDLYLSSACQPNLFNYNVQSEDLLYSEKWYIGNDSRSQFDNCMVSCVYLLLLRTPDERKAKT